MEARVEIRDRSFTLLEILDKEILDLGWDYARIGGCGGFSFSLPRKFCDEKYISGDFNIRIYMRNSSTKVWDLWYQGFVENKRPTVRGNSELIQVTGHGYSAQLRRIYVDVNYSSQEMSLIATNIVDTIVEPSTDIIYDATLIEATSFTPDTLEFNTDADSAIQSCADIVGTREWGVNKDRKFFFKARSSTVGFRYWLGRDIINLSPDDSFRDIINSVLIQGGDVAGVPYTKSYEDTLSQAKYGKRTRVLQNSSIVTDTVSAQFANAIFAEFNDVVRKAQCDKLNVTSMIESTIPIPLAIIMANRVLYGEKKYGTFLYSGDIERQINRIGYKVDNNGILSVSLSLDYYRPNISEDIAQLAYQLEQQRSSTL